MSSLLTVENAPIDTPCLFNKTSNCSPSINSIGLSSAKAIALFVKYPVVIRIPLFALSEVITPYKSLIIGSPTLPV